MDLVAIELQPEQALFLTLCNKQFATISFMHQSGVFDIRGGNALLSFDNTGKLLKIKRELYSVINSEIA